jgi:hypothetical protein
MNYMLIRTTLRVKDTLKKSAEQKAIKTNTTLQNVFNDALAYYLEQDAKNEAKKIVFKTHDLGVPLDNLKRSDYYSKP